MTKKLSVDLDDQDKDTQCGIGPCKGPCLQKLATKRSYLLVYSFLGLFQSMFFSYSIATLTTLEKQFKLKSQTTGILLSGNECSQILLSLFMTYFGGQGHRPRLAAFGVFFSGISSLLIVVPHFVYGQSTPLTNVTRNLDTCVLSPDSVQTTLSPEECAEYNQVIGPMVYIFMSQFISGIGTTLFSILGITYLDDNVKRKQTPMLIGLMSALRLIGPALGYGMAGMTMRRYVNLGEKTTLKPTDPAWIGAWWLGFIVIGTAQLSTCWLLAVFPKYLPKRQPLLRDMSTVSTATTATIATTNSTSRPARRTLKAFPAALKRLLTNKVLMLNNLSGIFFIFGISGYITFLPKYIETQFQQSAARSGLVNGGIGILFMCTGLLFGGWMISRFRPSAVKLALWDVFIGLLWAGLLICFSFIGCDSKPIHGLQTALEKVGSESMLLGMPMTPCNQDCNCQANRFAPACSEDGKANFFSACHAGCKTMNISDGRTIFSDCSCIKEWINATDDPMYEGPVEGYWQDGQAFGGYCPSNCFQIFWVYVIAMGIAKFLSSIGRVSNVIIGFRCVPVEDKSFAIGLGYLLVSLFAFIPAPIAFGAVIDKACILWRTDKCGERGNCWIYDPEKLRLYLHMLTAICILIGVFFDSFVVCAVKGLELYAEEDEQNQTKIKNGERRLDGKEMEPMLTAVRLPQPANNFNQDELMKTLET